MCFQALHDDVCFALWPLRRDDGSRDLVGAGGICSFDWPASVLANDVSNSRRARSD